MKKNFFTLLIFSIIFINLHAHKTQYDGTNELSDLSIDLTIIPGDSNCDDIVNIFDAITISNYILCLNPDPFCFENADITNDGIINIADLIATIDIILTGGTSFTCGISTITDIDGNIYTTVLINSQCWMKENLRTTKYCDGHDIEYPGSNNSAWQNNTNGAYAWYDNDINWKDIYGALYNWNAVNNAHKLCPKGWHVPNDSEWEQLVDYLSGLGHPNHPGIQNSIGNALKTCRQVDSPLGGECNTTEHPRWRSHSSMYGFDGYDFSAFPSGGRYQGGSFSILGNNGLWWSSTENLPTEAWSRDMYSSNANLYRTSRPKGFGFAVRCIKDL